MVRPRGGKTSRKLLLTALLPALLAGACGKGDSSAPGEIATEVAEEVPTLALPPVSSVARVQTSTQDRQSFVLTSPEDVAGLLDVLRSLDDRWEVTSESNPPFVYSAGLSSSDNTTFLVVWVGEDWLGAYDMQGKVNVRQPLVDPERGVLLRSLGVPPGVDPPSSDTP